MYMSEKDQILYMQTRIVRLAAEKWNTDVPAVCRIFSEMNVFEYIRQFFGIFHVEGDCAVLEDVEKYLSAHGVKVNG